MTSGVYWIYQTSRDRAVYVGSTNSIETRFPAHRGALKSGKHHNVRLIRTWNKYGADDFQFLLLEKCSIDQLIEREQFWMDAISPVCNMAATADNPNRGRHLSEEHRARISAANKGQVSNQKGKTISDEHKKKISLALTGRKYGAERVKKSADARRGKPTWSKGKKFSPECRQKMSDAKKGRPALNKGKKYGPEFSKKVSDSLKGIKLSDEHKKKISLGNMGRVVTEETREKIGNANKIKWNNPEYKKSMVSKMIGRKPIRLLKELICSDCNGSFQGKSQTKRVLCPVCQKEAWKIANKKSLMKRRGKL